MSNPITEAEMFQINPKLSMAIDDIIKLDSKLDIATEALVTILKYSTDKNARECASVALEDLEVDLDSYGREK